MRGVELAVDRETSAVDEMTCPELWWRSPRCAWRDSSTSLRAGLRRRPSPHKPSDTGFPTWVFLQLRPKLAFVHLLSHIALEGAGQVTFVIIRRARESDTIILRCKGTLGLWMLWSAGGNGDGSSDNQCDSTKHANPGGDSGERDQPGPAASVWRKVHGVDRERAGVRVSKFGGAAGRDSHHAERTSRRR